jgi:hypothetical protein
VAVDPCIDDFDPEGDRQPYVDHLRRNAQSWGVADRVLGVRLGVPDIKFADESFDAAYSTTALEMIRGLHGDDQYLASLEEVLRVLRPGALFAGQERRIWLRLRAQTEHLVDHTLGRVSLGYLADGEHRELALSSAPTFACVEGEEAYHASVDQEALSRNMVTDQFNKVKQRVSRSLHRREPEAARKAVAKFRREALSMNGSYPNDRLERSLRDADSMAKDLDDAIAGGEASSNALSKELAEEGLDGRRVGAKHD